MSPNDAPRTQFTRRDVLKMGGLAALSLPVINSIGFLGDHTLLASTEEYGGFLIKTRATGAPYQVDDAVYQRFDAYNNVFERLVWDKVVQDQFGDKWHSPDQWIADDKPGFHREEFALMNAGWTVGQTLGTYTGGDGVIDGLVSMKTLRPPAMKYETKWDRRDLTDADVTQMVKKAARFYGASMVGIAPLDERWVYTGTADDLFNPGERHPVALSDAVEKPGYQKDGTLLIPSSMHWVITMIFPMDRDAVETYPTPIGAATTAVGYSKMAFTAASMAEFIRGLGYTAMPLGNQVVASIPTAIDAGLGELGRHGLLITPKHGSAVQIAKVLVDLPLIVDQPISFGVTEFCEVCGKCAKACPPQAIDKGARTWKGTTVSNNAGVLKWYINPEKCFAQWAAYGISDCSYCIRECPFTKPQSWLHEATRILIGAKSGTIDKLLVNLDDASGYGHQVAAQEFWKKDA